MHPTPRNSFHIINNAHNIRIITYILLFFIIPNIYTSCVTMNKYYKQTLNENTISAYEDFINKYPNSKYTENIRILLSKLYEERDWELALKNNQVWLYEDFIKKYPHSQYVTNAKLNIKKLEEARDWNYAVVEGTVEAYKKYLMNYPNGIYYKTAQEKIREIEIIIPAWQKTEKTNTYEAYLSFVEKFPDSKYTDIAYRRLEEIERNDWNKASKTNTITAYKNYLLKYPYGSYTDEAEKKIIDLEVDKIFKGEYKKLLPMSKISQGYNYNVNEIEIFNNTKYKLTVRYSGSESKKVVLSPKQKTTINLQSGPYRIAASVDAFRVKDYAGIDTLKGGVYYQEFYIVTKTYLNW